MNIPHADKLCKIAKNGNKRVRSYRKQTSTTSSSSKIVMRSTHLYDEGGEEQITYSPKRNLATRKVTDIYLSHCRNREKLTSGVRTKTKADVYKNNAKSITQSSSKGQTCSIKSYNKFMQKRPNMTHSSSASDLAALKSNFQARMGHKHASEMTDDGIEIARSADVHPNDSIQHSVSKFDSQVMNKFGDKKLKSKKTSELSRQKNSDIYNSHKYTQSKGSAYNKINRHKKMIKSVNSMAVLKRISQSPTSREGVKNINYGKNIKSDVKQKMEDETFKQQSDTFFKITPKDASDQEAASPISSFYLHDTTPEKVANKPEKSDENWLKSSPINSKPCFNSPRSRNQLSDLSPENEYIEYDARLHTSNTIQISPHQNSDDQDDENLIKIHLLQSNSSSFHASEHDIDTVSESQASANLPSELDLKQLQHNTPIARAQNFSPMFHRQYELGSPSVSVSDFNSKPGSESGISNINQFTNNSPSRAANSRNQHGSGKKYRGIYDFKVDKMAGFGRSDAKKPILSEFKRMHSRSINYEKATQGKGDTVDAKNDIDKRKSDHNQALQKLDCDSKLIPHHRKQQKVKISN